MPPLRPIALLTACGGALVALACAHVPTEKDLRASEIHYDLGIQAQNGGNLQEAYAEYEEALKLDPANARAHDAIALLLHLAFQKPRAAIPHFEEALRLDPQFSEARVNLGNVYLDLKQYDQAIAQYERALNDMRYPTPYIAQCNLGWAEYKRGNTEKAINQIKASVTVNPKFCLGYRNLGTIYDDTGRQEEACSQLARYRENCPDFPDAYYREAVCLAKLGRRADAEKRFSECEAKAVEGQLKDDCRRLRAQLE
ncbi:MAG TPA: social motility TPR repeat lipoprotein Tgl [Myxococcaceae bacterium]|nr:social motility TPR repeat lipoprotein Tgl [Myxococcaceae bacterium]